LVATTRFELVEQRWGGYELEVAEDPVLHQHTRRARRGNQTGDEHARIEDGSFYERP